MPLRPEAIAFLETLPRPVSVDGRFYGIAIALFREGLVTLTNRRVSGNGTIWYSVAKAVR